MSASGNFLATVTRSLAVSGLPFVSSSFSYNPEALTPNVAAAVPQASAGNTGTATVSAAIGVLADLEFLYAYSDILDCTIQFFSGPAGGGTLEGTIHLTAGLAYLWDVNSAGGSTTPNGMTPWSSPIQSVVITVQGTAGAVWSGSAWVGGTTTTVATTANVTITGGASA